MADRFFVDVPIAGESARLTGSEAHHLAHVMRAKAGQQVSLFDGSGAEFAARIERVGRAEIELSVQGREEVNRELPVLITLAVALPKGDRQRWLVEKATELGAARLVPLVTERSNDRESSGALEKLRRSVIEASKQCGRNRLMEIAAPRPAASFWTGVADAARIVAHPGGAMVRGVLDAALADGKNNAITVAVGPEGGFTDAEIDAARAAGWQMVDLGRSILRVETAALALLAAIGAQG